MEHRPIATMPYDRGRVRQQTEPAINDRIDQKTLRNIDRYAQRTTDEISARIAELENAWDVERILEMNASALAFTGLLLGLTRSRKWLAVPAIVLPFLFQHAVQGWCPPLPLLRRLGVRTRREIDSELFALKAYRGDFETVNCLPSTIDRARAALSAANR